MSAGIHAVVLGATGYVGGEFLRLVSTHPAFDLAAAVSESRAGDDVSAAFPHLAAAVGGARFVAHADWVETIDRGAKVALFSAAPHGASAAIIAAALDAADARDLDVHVVDASADFRYARQADYEAVYGSHGAPGLLDDFCSGLPEHVAGAPKRHVGHPGCFATAMLLASVPLLASGVTDGELFATGITGSTGSGKNPQPGTHHPERHSNLYAYKPLSHRHAPEVRLLAEAATGQPPKLHFVPHSGPFARGIHMTIQASAPAADAEGLRAAFETAYGDAPFVELVDGTPRLKDVVASNRCRIGIATSADGVVVTAVIDNLVKGAAGGAVQWMNRLFGLDETAGLLAPAPAWT
jgi:N-acetyl-gamma-glutamyl-phosphate reductase common form